MAKLTAKSRNALSKSTFVFPETRKFPIPDKSHARNALARAGAKGGSTEAKVRAAVHRKFPSIEHTPQMGGSTHLSADSMKYEAMKGRSQNAAIKRDFTTNLHYACHSSEE